MIWVLCVAILLAPMVAVADGDTNPISRSELESYAGPEGVRAIMSSLLAAVMILCAVVILHRTASATLHSRFLRHLEYAILALMVFRVGAAVFAVFRTLVAIKYLSANPIPAPSPVDAGTEIKLVKDTWHVIAMMISFLSSLWLYLSWWLLRHYPDQSIPRGFYAGSIATASGLIVLSGALVNSLGAVNPILAMLLDVSAAATGIGLVGWELRKLARDGGQPALGIIVTFMYFSWSILQFGVLWFWDKPADSFWALLNAFGMVSIFTTAVLTALVLRDRPEFAPGAAKGRA